MIFIISCNKMEIEPMPQPTKENIFSVKESRINNGQDIYFDLPSTELYTLTLIDKNTNQVISREKFIGKVGINKLKIYTKTLKTKYLYLVLEDESKNLINKTTITIN